MCLSCACGKPNEKHGDERNITLQDVQAAAQAAAAEPKAVVTNIQEGFDQFGKGETAGAAAGGTTTSAQ